MHPADALARRAWLGLDVGPALEIVAVAADGPASRADLVAGDRMESIDGSALSRPSDLPRILREKRAHDEVHVHVTRDGSHIERVVRLAPHPLETISDGDLELGHVVLEAAPEKPRLRTFVTRPSSSHERRPALLLLPGLDCVSCEHPLEPEHPQRRAIDAWTRAGIVTIRVERIGVGDSEGPPARETGLDVELGTYASALDALAVRDDVDPARIFVFGTSFGGIVAPLVARGRTLAGIAVFGASARSWDDCVVQTMIRQRKLAGMQADELAAFVGKWAELVSLVVREGWTPEEAFAEAPHLRSCRSRDAEGRTLFGRDVALFQGLAEHDLFAAWRDVRAPVLVLHGEHDWVSSRQEAEEIAHAARGAFVELPGVAHDMRNYATTRESFDRRGSGPSDARLAEAVAEWIKRV